jgi:protein-L-isoaspartate(D-aspartate) O-methyltransferase
MDTLAARQQMVDQQIRTWEVLDPRVLDALARVPREAFVPQSCRDLAFADSELPIGSGQSMLAPKIQGRILQALGASTHSIDIHPELTVVAAANLRAMPKARVRLETRDAFDTAPLGEYDVIAMTGSLPVYDARFERRLRVGGRLFAVVGSAPVMEAVLIRRVDDGEWIRESLFETVIDPLMSATTAQRFVF